MSTRDPSSSETPRRASRTKNAETPPDETYTSVEEMTGVLAYAELRAVMVSWARGPERSPADLVRAAVDYAIADDKPLWHPDAASFGQHLRGLIRTETAGVLFRLTRTTGRGSSERPLGPGQVGDVPGLEVIFHLAGESAGDVRANETQTLATAVTLVAYVRGRVARCNRP